MKYISVNNKVRTLFDVLIQVPDALIDSNNDDHVVIIEKVATTSTLALEIIANSYRKPMQQNLFC